MANDNSKTPANSHVQSIPLAKIHDLSGVFIPKLPDKSYGGLVTSIQANGVREPVILRLREDGEYQLVTGYRRRKASELAKKAEIPALVYQMTEQEAREYHKNVQRQPNAPIPGKLVESPENKAKEQTTDIKEEEKPTAPTAGEKPEASQPDKVEQASAVPVKDERPQTGDPNPTAPVAEEKPEAPQPDKAEQAPAAPAKDERPQTGDPKPTAPVAEEKPEAPQPDKAEQAPAAPVKDEKPQTDNPKPTAPAAEEKPEAPQPDKAEQAPAAPVKDEKPQTDNPKLTDPVAEKKPEALQPDKAEQAPAAPAKEEKPQTGDPKSTAPAVEEKPEASQPDKVEQAPVAPAKDEKPQTDDPKPTEPTAEEKSKTSQPDKAEQAPTTSAKGEKPQTGDPKPTDPAAEEKPEPPQPAKSEQPPAKTEKPQTNKSAPPADTPKAAQPAAVPGQAAKGPSGTAISQVFEERLLPPDEKAKRDIPSPKADESFFILLHPAYLEKSKYNTISVNQQSEDYRELKKSIELNGVKDPVLARIGEDGTLEILSGQRRHMIATELNYPVPTIIQKIDDADAKILVADGNLHRPHISTYDLSRSLRMKMEGMKQKSGRRKKGTIKAEELDSDVKLAQEMGMSVSKLNRLIRLSEASADVCARVDDNSLHLSIASAISFLKPENQDKVLHLSDLGYKLTNERVERMKKVEKSGKLDEIAMRNILDDKDLAPKQTTPPPVPQPSTPPPIPASPDVKPELGQAAPPPAMAAPSPNTPASEPTAASTPEPPAPAENAPAQPAPVPAADSTPGEKPPLKGEQERPEYTKIILAGDRLRKYFPDVSMTPREIEESVYDALEERRQRQIKAQQRGPRSQEQDAVMEISATIANLGKYNAGELAETVLSFPTTAGEVQQALRQIGVDGLRYAEIIILECTSSIEGLASKLGEFESIDELNYLASRIAEMGQEERTVFAAAVEHDEYAGCMQDLINLTCNLSCYNLLPEIRTDEDYGRCLVDTCREFRLPRRAGFYFDYASYGSDTAINEGGSYTPQGYIYNNRAPFQTVYDGQHIPEQYRVFQYPIQEKCRTVRSGRSRDRPKRP